MVEAVLPNLQQVAPIWETGHQEHAFSGPMPVRATISAATALVTYATASAAARRVVITSLAGRPCRAQCGTQLSYPGRRAWYGPFCQRFADRCDLRVI
jgi:hypothetical protein